MEHDPAKALVDGILSGAGRWAADEHMKGVRVGAQIMRDAAARLAKLHGNHRIAAAIAAMPLPPEEFPK